MVDGTRSALIIASSDYADPELRRLRAPASDARALESVLHDPGIGGFEVRTLLNKPVHEVALAVEEFFADRQPDDLLLVHFSCHGIKDQDGDLYFAMPDTRMRRLASTAVAASFVNQRMTRSRSKRVILLLDCCNAGAFERGMTPRAAGGMDIQEQFGGGRGRAVITASNSMQYAYERGELTATDQLAPSVFTSALVDGLKTGEADRDQDGLISLDDLYYYVYDKVTTATPNQTPCKWTYDIRGELVLARRSRPVTTPSPLPDDIRKAIESRLASVRLGAVQELEILLRGQHEGLALAARLTLQKLTNDDSRAVSAAATAALGIEESQPVPPRLQLSTTSLDFGPVTRHSQSPEHMIRLGNAGGGSLNANAATEASWIQLRQVEDELYVAVDTDAVGAREGTVTIDSNGGSATILVKASIADEMMQPPARKARSAGTLLDVGFIIVIITQCIIALEALTRPRTPLLWPWWTIFAACILGIAFTLGGVKKYTVPASSLLWAMAWSAAYSVSVVATIHSSTSTQVTGLSTECIVAAVVGAALFIWIVVLLPKGIRYLDLFLAIFIGCFSIAAVLGAIALHTGKLAVWNTVGVLAFAAALGAFVTLIRAHQPRTSSS